MRIDTHNQGTDFMEVAFFLLIVRVVSIKNDRDLAFLDSKYAHECVTELANEHHLNRTFIVYHKRRVSNY